MKTKNPLTATEIGQNRDARNKAAGLVRVAPSYWIMATDTDAARADIKRVMNKYQKKARKSLDMA